MSDSQIRAVLSAKDNMSAVFNKASEAVGRLKSGVGQTIKTGAAFSVGMKAVSAATNAVSSSIGTAVKRYDTLNNFTGVMENLGIESNRSKKALKSLSKGIDGLPTTLDSAASGVQAFVSANGNIKKSTKYFLAMNDAIVAGGQSTQIQQAAVEQLSQAYAKGKMDMQEWRSLQTAMPAQLKQVAKAMGMTTTQLGEGLRTGSVSMDDFMNTMVQLDKKGIGSLASFSEQAKSATGGIATSIANMKTSVAKGIASMLETTDKALEKNKLPTTAGIIQKATEGIGSAFKSVNKFISNTDWSGVIAKAKPYFELFKNVVVSVGHALLSLAGFLVRNADAISRMIPPLLIAVGAWKAMKIVSALTGPISMITSAFSKLASGTLAKLIPQLTATAVAEKEVGTGAKASAGSVMKMGVAVLAMGAGVALACAGLALLAQSAIALAGAGGGAIAVMAGMVAVIAGLAVGAALLGGALTAGAIGFIAFGAAVLMAAAGMYVMAKAVSIAAPPLSKLIDVLGKAVSGVLNAVAGIFDSIGNSALNAGKGFQCVAAGIKSLVKMKLADLAATLATTARGLKKIGSAAGDVGSAAKSFSTLNKALSSAKTPLSSLTAAFKSAGTAASSAGKTTGTGFANGVKSGMNSAKNHASSGVKSVVSTLKSGRGGAEQAGSMISAGFAAGIRSSLDDARAAGEELAKIAEKAVRDKAKIKSPSRVFMAIGEYVGEGFAMGIESTRNMVRRASESMISLPNASGNRYALAGASLPEGAAYGQSFTVEVPLEVDGKQFAKATAVYNKAEISRLESRASRRKGKP